MNLHVDFTKPVDGEVIFVDSLRRFWFRPWSWEDCLLTVSSSMETSSSLWPVATLINKETFYCAKFSEDQLYYRCRILDVKGDNVDVEYIDYKNTETKLKTEILDLPAELQKIQPLVMNLKTKLNKYANNEKNKLALEDYLFGEGLSLAIDDGVVQEYYINGEKAKLKKVLEKKEEGVTSPTRPIKEKKIVTPSTKSSNEEEGVALSPSVEKVTPATSAKKENEGVASSNKPRKGDSTTRNENEESSSNLDPREEKIAKLVQKESIETLGKSPILKEKSKVDIIAKETIAVSAEKPKASSDTGGGSLTKAKTPVRTTEKGLPLFVKLDGTVVFVEDVKTVWFTQDIFADAINDLMDKLAVAGPTLPPAEDINLEHSYATTFSEDDGYYRCRVLEMTEDGKVRVQFIDFGNIEGKEKKDILALTPELKKMMPAAIKVPVFDTVNVENSKCNYELLNDALVGQQVQISMEVVDGVKLGKIFIDNKRLELKFDSGIQEALERHLPTGVKIPGTVVFIENINEIFFTQSSEMSTLEEVMESLASLKPTFYKVDEPKVGELYGCIFSEDENLYRCKVLSQEDDGFKVQFVDYGNSEVKKMGDFLSLPTNLKEPLPFAIKLKTSIKNKESILESLEAELMYSDLEVIIDSEGFATFERAGIQLVSSAPPSQTKDNIMVESKDAPVYTESPLPIGIKVPVLLGDLNSVHIIWISLGEVEGFLDEEKNGAVVQAILEDESCLDAANMGQLVPQQVYVARFKVDNLLYRARVLEVKSDGTAEVVFIDFGNTDVCSEFYHLRDELSGIPPAAHRVQIITNSGVKDSIDNRDKLRGILDTANLEVVLEKSGTGYLGRIFVNGSELDTGDLTQASDLQKETCLRLDQMTPTANNNLDNSSGFEVGVAVEVSVPHVETAEEVMVQRLPNLGLDNLMCNLEALNETGTLKVEQCPKLNGVYIARFSEDDGLYRGRVEELNGDQVKIRFIDYGNTENKTVGELLEMPLDMAKVPPFAIRVRIRCLLGVEHSQGNMDLLDQMLMQDGIVLTLESESTGDFTIGGQPIDVSLFKKKALPSIPAMPVAKECSTKDIAEPLPKECARTDFDKHVAQKVIVSHVESVEDVMVQMVSNQGGLDELMDSLDALDAAGNPKPALRPQLNALYIARFSEDNSLYRGRVEELNGDQCKIRFIDYGNMEHKSVGELLEMPREMSNIPPFATSVKVECLIGFDNIEENRILLDTMLLEDEVSVTRISANVGIFTIGDQPIDVSLFKKTTKPNVVAQPKKETVKPKEVALSGPKDITAKPKEVATVHVKAAEKAPTTSLAKPSTPTRTIKDLEMAASGELEVYLVSIESVSKIWVNIAQYQDALEEMMEKLQNCPDLVPLQHCSTGANAICRYSDGDLYRVRVFAVKGDKVHLIYLDYGNKEWTSPADLMEIPEEFCEIPALALQLTVKSLPIEDTLQHQDIVLKVLEEQPSFKVKYRVQGNQVQCKLPKPLSADVLEQVEAKRAIWMDPVETKKAPYGAATAGVNKVIQLSPEKLRQAEVEVSQPRIPSTDSESGRVVSGELTTSVLDALTNPATRSLGISNLQGMSVPLTLERALEMKLVKESDVLNLEPEKGGGDAPVQKSSSVSQAAKIASNREDSIRGDAEKIRSVRPRTNPAEAQPTLVSGEIARLNISKPGATRPSTPKVSRPMTPEGLEEENSGPTPQKVSRPNRPEESRPIQTEVSRPALSAFPKAIEANRMPGWARGEKVLGYWSKDNQWRNAVIIDINRDEAMIACTSDPDVETITVPLGHIKSNSMPLTSLNIMENQIAEQQKRNEPPRTMNPDSPVFAPKTSRIAPLNRGNNNITTNRGYNNNTIPFQFNNNNSSLPFTINANVSNVGIAALSPEEPKKLSFIKVETSMYSSSELSSLAKTLSGSTKLQSELTSRTNPALTKQILNIVLQSPVEFINHHRATYLVQTLAGVLSSSDLCVLSEVVSQHFTVIATSKAGTHLAQTLASNKNRIVAKVMSRSLMSIKNLPRFLNDINGSYVAQVCLNETTDKDTFMFLVAGILPDLASICCGAHSTFFIQKLIPFAKSMGFADLNLIVKGVINNIGLLAFNPNGTRIVQAAVGVCSESQMEKMALWLKADLRIVYKSREAVYVAQEILDQIINRTGEDKWTNILLGIVNVLLNDTEDGRPLLICAALSMSGSKICLQLFKIIRGPIKADIMALVSKYHQELAASVNGAVIIKALN